MTHLIGVMQLNVTLTGVVEGFDEGEPSPVAEYLLDFSDEDMSMYLGVIEMANTRALSYWWPSGYPTKWGLCVPWNNYDGLPPIEVMSASSYLNTKFFKGTTGVNSFASTVYPYHGCIPPFYTYLYDFPEGWAQTNWKTCMYIPMLFIPNVAHAKYAGFKALLAQFPNKRVMIGNEPNDIAQGRVTPQEFANAILDLKTVAPNLSWVGPNIITPYDTDLYPDPNLNNTSASCSRLAWLNAYHALVVANPALKPTVWSFHIYADDTAQWNQYYTMISQWLIAHNYKINSYTAEPIWLTETAISRCVAGGSASNATAEEQRTLINILNSYMTTRSDFPIKLAFTYCAVDDEAGGHKIGAWEVYPPTTPKTYKPPPNPYSNNEYEIWNDGQGVYNYTSVGQYWDDRVTYWPGQPPYTPDQKRPWAAPKRAPATKVNAFPILTPSL